MKSSPTFVFWFFVILIGTSMLVSAQAASTPAKPTSPPPDCSCGVCEDQR